MKNASSYTEFVEYNDGDLSHVLSGPDYGQVASSDWTTDSSFEKFYLDRYSFNGFTFRLLLA
jgi:hypothetical protein